MNCELCARSGGTLLWRGALCRVVHVEEPGYPGYCRVIWNEHVKEMTDLPPVHRAHLLDVVFAVERLLRSRLKPVKINLASLGNVTPHLHWHVIPRFADDPHFPQPIWSVQQREPTPREAADLDALAEGLSEMLGAGIPR
jgi:diadenosine tetraphosphate (Ap4A) HIT family hydrolase